MQRLIKELTRPRRLLQGRLRKAINVTSTLPTLETLTAIKVSTTVYSTWKR